MSKFDEQFKEVNWFTGGFHAITGKISKDEARNAFIKYGCLENDSNIDCVTADRVRFGFAPENIEGLQGELCWFSGATGKGSMPIWMCKS